MFSLEFWGLIALLLLGYPLMQWVRGKVLERRLEEVDDAHAASFLISQEIGANEEAAEFFRRNRSRR